MVGTGLGCPHPGCGHPAAPPQLPGLPPPAKGPPGPPRQEWLAPHRLGQLGKILPRELDHVAHPQDRAEGGSVGVEAAGLHIGGCQVREEVPPGEWRGVEVWVSFQRQPSGCSPPPSPPPWHIRQMSAQVSRGSAGEYQADERAVVTQLRWRVSGR